MFEGECVCRNRAVVFLMRKVYSFPSYSDYMRTGCYRLYYRTRR